MTNSFETFDNEWGGADPADRFTPIPSGRYKVVCAESPSDSMVDVEVVENPNNGNKGIKVWFEIVFPETVLNGGKEVTLKGRKIEHVFWVTKGTLPFIKRDILSIRGEIPEKVSTLPGLVWAGRTCEIVVKEEEVNGYSRTNVRFINPWKPKETAKVETQEKSEEARF